jgi:AcrR family transcriptional regulator
MQTRTPELSRPTPTTDAGRVDRLIQAAAAQLAGVGAAGASARSIAAAAGASASAINYNFGGIEQLFLAAFALGAAQTSAWIAARRAHVEALPRTPTGAVLALEYLLAAWAGEGRGLALLYQEALARGAGRGPAAAWTALWRDAWLELAAAFGLGAAEGRILHALFEFEALYNLSRWSPALEAAALRETCTHLGAVCLGAARAPPTGALALAERTAGVQPVGGLPPAALRIAQAAAEVVERDGLPGLTHRAVAAQAGVTTGAVTHHFRTIEDLVAGAIRGQVLMLEIDMVAARPPTSADVQSLPELFATARAYAVVAEPWGPGLRRRHLFLAAQRRGELAAAGAVIRFAHGSTTREALQRLAPLPPDTLSLYSGLLSRLLSGLWFACSAEPSPREAAAALLAEIETRFRRDVEGGADRSP